MNNFLELIINESLLSFGENLICILLLGSVQKNDTTPFSDVDLIGVLMSYDTEGSRNLRRFIGDSPRLVDYSILALDELSANPDKFRVGSHGCYQLELVYKHADCIYGKNIFLSFPSPSQNALRESIFQKISEYVWWMRRMYVEANRERSMYSNYQLNSRLIKLLRDFCFLAGVDGMHFSSEKVISLFLENFPAILSEEEINLLTSLANKSKADENAGNMSETFLFQRVSIANKIFEQALLLV